MQQANSLPASDRCVPQTAPTVRGTAFSKIRTIPGPAIPPEPREAPFAQVSAVLPLYHQQTKNLLVSYSAKKRGSSRRGKGAPGQGVGLSGNEG